MDLRQTARVLGRHRLTLVAGVVLAILLATLSYYRVTTDGLVPELTPRKAELWQSQANIFLTESGFPAGRKTIPLVTTVVAGEAVPVPEYSDPVRFARFASLYARLAQSDAVRKLMEKRGPLPGSLAATPTFDTSSRNGEPLPMLSLLGKAPTAAGAKATVTRGLEAFLAYMAIRQKEAKIPKDERVQLHVINVPQPAVLLEPRKKTLPVVVFLAVMIAALAVAFIRENVAATRANVGATRENVGATREGVAPSSPAVARVEPVDPARSPAAPAKPEETPEPVASVRRWA